MQKLGFTVLAFVAACALTTAQEIQKTTATKVKVKDGKEVKVTGCIERTAEGFALTHVANEQGAMDSYLLAGDLDDVDGHVGHRVEIEGKAANKGDGKIVVETKNRTEVGEGNTRKTSSKSEISGDLHGLPYLGVDSVRMIASVCP